MGTVVARDNCTGAKLRPTQTLEKPNPNVEMVTIKLLSVRVLLMRSFRSWSQRIRMTRLETLSRIIPKMALTKLNFRIQRASKIKDLDDENCSDSDSGEDNQ